LRCIPKLGDWVLQTLITKVKRIHFSVGKLKIPFFIMKAY